MKAIKIFWSTIAILNFISFLLCISTLENEIIDIRYVGVAILNLAFLSLFGYANRE